MNPTFEESLQRWLSIRSLGRKPRTVDFYDDVVQIILKHWPAPGVATAEVTEEMILSLAKLVSHHCPSRWNTIVAALRHVTPHGKVLTRRRINIRKFNPPSHAEFAALLAECDRMRRTSAGLVVRFLSHTGLRISEAMALTWLNVFTDRIDVPAEVTKSGKARSIPHLPGLREALDGLRKLESGGYVLPRANARKAIETASRRVGLQPLSHHCFRHLFATRCIQSGVDLPTVARWLGHQDGGALLAKTYFHLVDEHSRRMAGRVKI